MISVLLARAILNHLRSLEFPPLASCLLTVLPTCSFPSFESFSVFACLTWESAAGLILGILIIWECPKYWSPFFCKLKDWSRMWCQCMLGWGDWEYFRIRFFQICLEWLSLKVTLSCLHVTMRNTSSDNLRLSGLLRRDQVMLIM